MNLKADVLIVTVTQVESQAVMEVFKEATGQDPKSESIGKKTYQNLGEVNKVRVFLALSEMGSGGLGASQQAVQKAIEALSPAAVIMVGIAFGVNNKKQKIGDILLARQLVPYSFQKVETRMRGEQKEQEFLPRDERPHCSPWLFDSFRWAVLSWKGPTVHIGQVLTGEILIDNLEFRNELLKLAPEAIGGEMEGRGLYVTCQEAGVDWILVKAICDWADGNKAKNKNARQRLAAHNAANFVLHTLKQVPLRREQVIVPHPPADDPIAGFIRKAATAEYISKVVIAEIISFALMMLSIWITRNRVPPTATLDEVIQYALSYSVLLALLLCFLIVVVPIGLRTAFKEKSAKLPMNLATPGGFFGWLENNYVLLLIATFPGNILLFGWWLLA